MSLIIKKCKTKHYYITLEFTNNFYLVQVCPLLNDNMCGYPVREIHYTLQEFTKAKRTFKRYTQKYI